jgi:hypothetical protein
MDEARGLVDRNGVRLVDALREHGIDFERVKDSGRELANAAAYLELHIEQGPVLLDLDLPLGAVLGTFGVERHAIHFHGQAAHSGSTPMNRRRDAFLACGENESGDLSHRGTQRRRSLHDRAHAPRSRASSRVSWKTAASRSISGISTARRWRECYRTQRTQVTASRGTETSA